MSDSTQVEKVTSIQQQSLQFQSAPRGIHTLCPKTTITKTSLKGFSQ